MSNLLMECGHTANATENRAGTKIPVCVICAGGNTGYDIPARNQFDLTGRIAKCAYGKNPGRYWYGTPEEHDAGVPSSYDLAFFEYKGEGSKIAQEQCKCGYFEVAHASSANLGKHLQNADGTPNDRAIKHEFEARGAHEFDAYYCGCFGWD